MIIAEYSVEIAIAVEVGDGRIMRSAFRRGGFRDWGLRRRGGHHREGALDRGVSGCCARARSLRSDPLDALKCDCPMNDLIPAAEGFARRLEAAFISIRIRPM
jgi:hypothetical protein